MIARAILLLTDSPRGITIPQIEEASLMIASLPSPDVNPNSILLSTDLRALIFHLRVETQTSLRPGFP